MDTFTFLIIALLVVIGIYLARPAPTELDSSRNYKKAPSSKKTKYTASDIAWNELPDEFVVFDLETTGMKSNKIPVDIVEISAVKVIKDKLKSGSEVETFTALVKPYRGTLNSEATRVNGITQRMIDKEGEDIREVMPKFIEFVGDRLLVAYNVDFDRWFLNRELQELGIKKRYKYECAYLLAKEAFPNLENYRLTTVASKLGINTDGAHRALADCVMAMHVYIWGKTFTKDGKDVFDALLPYQVSKKEELRGLDIAFTGTLVELTRDQAKRMAENSGMTVKTAISKKVDFLVVGEEPGQKLEKAKELGIKILNEDQFIQLVT